ncbi:MAG: CAP domain-containing protein [candidate division SR1 bacterium]|nr:CAP domain-containing protein [candidate division SR1 bacterium]
MFLGTSYAQDTTLPAHVNFSKVQSAWLDWQNTERKKLGLATYTGNSILQSSAQDRAEALKDMGTVTHQRKASDGYYNYRSIKSRFGDHGVGFSDDSGTLFSESLGWGYYVCSKDDCTDSLIKAIKSTFTFFMNEKGKWSQPHYKAIISKDFTSVGLGIATIGKQYYLVSHYGRNIVKADSVKLAKLK